MAQTITTNQIGNQVVPVEGDPDYIPPNEKSADDLELEAERAAAEAEAKAKLEEEAAQRQQQRREPPPQNLEGEARRLREQRDRLRADKEAADRELAQLRMERERWNARQEVEREAQERVQKMQRDAQRPDPETDPYGAQLFDMQQELKEQKKMREEWDQQRQQQQAYMQQQQQTAGALQEIQNYVTQDVTRYKSENPEINYEAAAQHVHDKYMEFWQSAGLTPQEAEAVTANTFLAVGRTAQLRNQSAAGAIANLATLTGWQPEVANPGNPKPPVNNGGKENAQEKINRIAKGQKLQGLGGKTPSERTTGENIGLLTAEQMANLSDDDYLRMKQDPSTARLLEKRLEELG